MGVCACKLQSLQQSFCKKARNPNKTSGRTISVVQDIVKRTTREEILRRSSQGDVLRQANGGAAAAAAPVANGHAGGQEAGQYRIVMENKESMFRKGAIQRSQSSTSSTTSR